MAWTDPFGDFSDNYQRYGVIPTGGMAIECGCITATGDATFYVPTHFNTCFAVLIGSGVLDGTFGTAGIPCVSDGYIKCSMSDTNAAGWHNYIAVGN